MKLSVHLVTWNGAKYIPFLFSSLRNQTCKDWTLAVLDNNSSDNTVELIKKELNDFPVSNSITVNSENRGFAGGHNQLFSRTGGEYFVLLNQDLYLTPDCLGKLIAEITVNQKADVVAPRIMKWNFSVATIDLEKSFTGIIDSLGLKVYRNRRVVEIGAGEIWNPRDAGNISVFGVSGAMPLFRSSVIKNIAFSDHEFFDSLYGSYKEDVDLAFRLRSAGYQSCVISDAVVYHDRTAVGPRELSDRAAAENKPHQSARIRYHSYKNHILTLYKNEYWQNFILDFPFILWYELKKMVWFFFFDRDTLQCYREIRNAAPELKNKRLIIDHKRTVSWREIRRWFH